MIMPDPIYTKNGDKGKTGLLSGERIEKIDDRVEAYGTVDELSASLGVAKVFSSEVLKKYIEGVQQKIFYLATELATKESKKLLKKIISEDTKDLENIMDKLSKEMPPATHFIVPGGEKAAAFLHQARTICRRAERYVIKLSNEEKINLEIIRFLNRLSDFLFVLARYANIIDGNGDLLISREGTFWQKKT